MNIHQAAKAGFGKVRKPEWGAGHFVDLRIDPATGIPNEWVHVHTPAMPGHYGIDGYVDTVSAASFANDYDFVNYEPEKQSKGDQVLVIGSRVEVIGGHWTGIVGTYAGLVEVDGLGGMMYHKVMLDDVNYCLVRPARFLKRIP